MRRCSGVSLIHSRMRSCTRACSSGFMEAKRLAMSSHFCLRNADSLFHSAASGASASCCGCDRLAHRGLSVDFAVPPLPAVRGTPGLPVLAEAVAEAAADAALVATGAAGGAEEWLLNQATPARAQAPTPMPAASKPLRTLLPAMLIARVSSGRH